MSTFETPAGSRGTRRRVVSLLAAASAFAVALTGFAPAAVAKDAHPKQWYLSPMQAQKIWKSSNGKGVEIGLVDSGVNASTPSLRGQVVAGKDTSGAPGNDRTDTLGHGTMMAELIAGTGHGGGLRGMAPGVKVASFRTNLKGMQHAGTESRSDEAIRAAADSDAKIINLSIGNRYYSAKEQEAVKYAASKGKLMFASVGNERQKGNQTNYPAAYEEVVGIGSTDEQGKVSDYSESGDDVDLTAPGSDIPGYCHGDFTHYCGGDGGTSAASAIASASAALIWSKHPHWTANQVLRVMFETAGRASKKTVRSKYIGFGEVRPRINVIEGKGDPGDPGKNPLTGERGGPAKSASGKATSGSGNGSGAGSGKDNAADKTQVADSDGPGDNSGLWTGIGVGAAVIVGVGGGVFAYTRLRRN